MPRPPHMVHLHILKPSLMLAATPKAVLSKDSSLKGENLIFINETGRKRLHVHLGEEVKLEEIQGEALNPLFAIHGARADDSHIGWIWIKPSSQNTELLKKTKNRRPLVLLR